MAVKRGKKQARRSGESSIPGWMWLLVGLLIGGALAVTLYVRMPHAIDSLLPHPNPAAHPTAAGDAGVAPEGNPAAASSVPKKPKYDFYTLLPEKEVIIPDEELSAQVKAEAAAKLASQHQATLPVASDAKANALPNTATAVTPTAAADVPATQAPSTNASMAADATSATTATGSSSTAIATSASSPQSGQYLLQAGAFRNGEQADDLKARIAMLGLVGRVEVVQTPAGAMHRVRLGPYATASELEQAKQKLSGGGLPAVAIRVK
jgi:cell division protein FtsN